MKHLFIACFCAALSTELIDNPERQLEVRETWNTAASYGANIGIWCMAQNPITVKTKSAEKHLEKIEKCISDKMAVHGVAYQK